MIPISYKTRIVSVVTFAIAMAYLEAIVVVYLRELFYPEGFSFPLKLIPRNLIYVELGREFSTIIMLIAVAALSAKRFWDRFGYFIIMFGIWDIFYYIWLKITIGWPSSLLDWDILFLIPLPWIGPVIAPVSIAVLMIVGGLDMTHRFARGSSFRPTLMTWILWIAGTAVILYSFMYDTTATIDLRMPQPYLYWLLISGLVLYVIGYIMATRKKTR